MNSPQGFGDRIARAMRTNGPLCVGIDPHPALLKAWGLEDSASGAERFGSAVLEAAADRVAYVKPQVALFERFGSSGLQALEDLLAQARDAGILMISDAKRGDIGSTMAAYADAWLGASSPLASDAVTLSPYLGFESLRPALDAAAQQGRGTFVLALTSNPEGKSVQHVGGDDSVASRIVDAARSENDRVGYSVMGPCGLVVGATVGPALHELDIKLSTFNGPILAPGYGAQGATAEDLYRVFEGCRENVLANSSRGILKHGPSVGGLVDAIGQASQDLIAARGN
ncbi:orotidine-5'-phosphate decarboxylase [Rothia sp. LK2588]|uniref:orotidine-5'-phosphate decarboxylase n=1 Tax=Rothia sp. LK2588 TaxID=3114369 RepID=UPI0034CF0391